MVLLTSLALYQEADWVWFCWQHWLFSRSQTECGSADNIGSLQGVRLGVVLLTTLALYKEPDWVWSMSDSLCGSADSIGSLHEARLSMVLLTTLALYQESD